jgi:hypothetical protein
LYLANKNMNASGLQGVGLRDGYFDTKSISEEGNNAGDVNSSAEELDDLCKVLAGIGYSNASKGTIRVRVNFNYDIREGLSVIV